MQGRVIVSTRMGVLAYLNGQAQTSPSWIAMPENRNWLAKVPPANIYFRGFQTVYWTGMDATPGFGLVERIIGGRGA